MKASCSVCLCSRSAVSEPIVGKARAFYTRIQSVSVLCSRSVCPVTRQPFEAPRSWSVLFGCLRRTDCVTLNFVLTTNNFLSK